MTIYHAKFFKTKEEAKAFTKTLGYGVIFSNIKYSHTKKDYLGELALLGRYDDEEFKAEYPYVVAWNEFIKGV